VQAWVDIEKPLKNVILQMKHIYIGRVGTWPTLSPGVDESRVMTPRSSV
jgi:hypothetical protein